VANAQARYETELANGVRPFAAVQYTYRSSVFGSVDAAAYTRIDGYSVVNARVGARSADGRYEASLWVNNAFDEVYFNTLGAASIPGAGSYGVTGQLGAPQTWGVTLRAEY
jgi:iron complex outermembrane receptor protein